VGVFAGSLVWRSRVGQEHLVELEVGRAISCVTAASIGGENLEL
jgi:hypothetical protein